MRASGFRSLAPVVVAVAAVCAAGCKNKAQSPKKAPAAAEAKDAAGEAAKKAEDPAKKTAKSKSNELPALPSDTLAKIGDQKVSMKTFNEIFALKKAKYTARGKEMPKTAERRYRRSIADRLVYQALLKREAAKHKLTPDTEALTKRIEASKYGMKDWSKHLARRGETDASLEAIYRAELLEKAILEKRKTLDVSDAEIKTEYDRIKDNYKSSDEQIRASHILISTRPDPGAAMDEKSKQLRDKAAKELATKVYRMAKAKDADFAALAKEHSDGPSKHKGGDLGIFSAKRMVKEFSDAAFKLRPGQVSKPVRTKFGYHVIKTTARYKPGRLPLEALEDQIRERLTSRKLLEGKRALKRELMEQKDIENFVTKPLGEPPSKAPPMIQGGPIHGHGGHGHGHGGHGHGHGGHGHGHGGHGHGHDH